jgi:hypothetical protein
MSCIQESSTKSAGTSCADCQRYAAIVQQLSQLLFRKEMQQTAVIASGEQPTVPTQRGSVGAEHLHVPGTRLELHQVEQINVPVQVEHNGHVPTRTQQRNWLRRRQAYFQQRNNWRPMNGPSPSGPITGLSPSAAKHPTTSARIRSNSPNDPVKTVSTAAFEAAFIGPERPATPEASMQDSWPNNSAESSPPQAAELCRSSNSSTSNSSPVEASPGYAAVEEVHEQHLEQEQEQCSAHSDDNDDVIPVTSSTTWQETNNDPAENDQNNDEQHGKQELDSEEDDVLPLFAENPNNSNPNNSRPNDSNPLQEEVQNSDDLGQHYQEEYEEFDPDEDTDPWKLLPEEALIMARDCDPLTEFHAAVLAAKFGRYKSVYKVNTRNMFHDPIQIWRVEYYHEEQASLANGSVFTIGSKWPIHFSAATPESELNEAARLHLAEQRYDARRVRAEREAALRDHLNSR